MKISVLLFCLWAYFPILLGQSPIVLPFDFKSQQISREVRMRVIGDSSCLPGEIAKLNPLTDFEPVPSKGLVFPYRKCSYWLRFQVQNKSQFNHFFLEVANVSIYDIRLFQKKGDTLLLIGEGGYKIKKTPKRSAILYNFELFLPQDSLSELYLFANNGRTGNSIFLPIRLVEGDLFFEMLSNKRWQDGVFSGAGFFILLFGFAIFWANRTKAAVWLLGFMVSAIFYAYCYNGMLHRLFWEYIHEYTRLVFSLIISFFQHFAAFLYIHFNNLKQNAPKLAIFIKVFLALGWMVFLYQSKRYFYETNLSDHFINYIQLLYFVIPLTVLFSSIWMAFKFRSKKYVVFPVVWTCQMISTFWLILMNIGVHNLGIFYRDTVLSFSILLDFVLFTTWFSYEIFLLKTDHNRQQLLLAETRANAAENLLLGQQEERRRLKLRIHDGLGILLASARMRLSKLAANQENLKPIERDIAAAVTEARNLSHDLEPETLQEGRLLDALRDTIGRVKGVSTAQIQFVVDNNLDESLIIQKIKIALFYSAQELLYNSIKHAEATEIKMTLYFMKETHIALRLEDNGKGLYHEEEESSSFVYKGIGLSNIEDRVGAVGGKFISWSPEYGGLVSEIVVPLSDVVI
jgi:signal transduction histidine kinase